MSRAMYVGQDGYGIKDEGWAYVCVWGGLLYNSTYFYICLRLISTIKNKKGFLIKLHIQLNPF